MFGVVIDVPLVTHVISWKFPNNGDKVFVCLRRLRSHFFSGSHLNVRK